MVEEVEKSRAWPKADKKLSKDIVELLNQSTHQKLVWHTFFIPSHILSTTGPTILALLQTLLSPPKIWSVQMNK